MKKRKEQREPKCGYMFHGALLFPPAHPRVGNRYRAKERSCVRGRKRERERAKERRESQSEREEKEKRKRREKREKERARWGGLGDT